MERYQTPPHTQKEGTETGEARGHRERRRGGASGRRGVDGGIGRISIYSKGGNGGGDLCGRGPAPPQRKMRTSRTSQPKVHTCCCGRSMETFLTTTNGLHLDGGVTDNALWQHCWRRLSAQLDSWCAMPIGAVGRRFTAILAAE